MFNILIVEDDKNTRKLMATVLKNNGYHTFLADDGLHALDILDKQQIDLILLDAMMPNMDGYEFTKTLRENKWTTPIFMITAKETITDKRLGFNIGVDDYMVKPVDEEEMLLRINALLRRAQIAYQHMIKIGSVILNYETLTVSKDAENIVLPKKEFYLLYKLLSYPNVIFTKFQLMDEIWGMENESVDHTINVHINRLRNKFENYPEFEIITVRNLGYKAVIKHE